MIDLVARQVQILRAIIEEFIETAEPVGSETVDKKFNIGVSPATIRNEMVYLSNQGYLYKPHVSGGRVPTPRALKLYVNELMKERELSVADEVSAKEKIWHSRNELARLLRESARVLADKSRALGLVMTDDRRLYHSGYANLLEMPEFYDINVMRTVLSMIEQASLMEEIFQQGESEDKVHLVYGKELGEKNLEPVGVMFITVNAQGRLCRLGVLGSERFDYPYMVPMMKYFKGLIEEIV
ncbi:MAG: hypothetical protein GF381_03850 [Candidatus Pacebacteria bacterium]|nr:hypothetical protein [Candidatus Paceibacterota bacterium]